MENKLFSSYFLLKAGFDLSDHRVAFFINLVLDLENVLTKSAFGFFDLVDFGSESGAGAADRWNCASRVLGRARGSSRRRVPSLGLRHQVIGPALQFLRFLDHPFRLAFLHIGEGSPLRPPRWRPACRRPSERSDLLRLSRADQTAAAPPCRAARGHQSPFAAMMIWS